MNALLLLSSLALAAPDAETLQTIWTVEASRGDATALAPLLEHGDPETRARATLALARLRDPQNLDTLQAQLADPDPAVREAAAFGLGLTEGGVPAARAALTTEQNEAVRCRLLESLGMQPDTQNLSVLVAALSEGPAATRSAAGALARHGMAKTEGVQDATLLEALTQVLRGNWLDPEPRVAAAFALARIAPVSLTAELQAELLHKADHDRSATVRAFLVRALSTATAGATTTRLLQAASVDPDRGVRIAAARALGKTGTELEVELMLTLLQDAAWDVQLAAVHASAGMEALDHSAALAPFLEAGTPTDLQAAAIAALGSAGEREALRPFLDSDQPVQVRVATIGTLQDPDQLLRLLERAHEAPIRSAIAGRLVELEVGPEVALVLLKSTDPAVVAVGLSILGESEDPRWIADILLALVGPPAVDPELPGAGVSMDLDVLREGLAALDTLLGLLPARTPAPAAAAAIIEDALQHPSVSVRQAAQGPAARVGVSAQAPAPVVPQVSDLQGIIGARIITDSGELWIEFETEIAPMTVWNFVQLAEAQAFDGNNFHRVLPDFVIQDGCPRGDGWGGPGYSIVDELSWLPYDEGTLAMALSGPDTGGSQWFLTLAPQPHLDAGYTVFGRLVGGTSHAVHQGTVIVDVIIERAP